MPEAHPPEAGRDSNLPREALEPVASAAPITRARAKDILRELALFLPHFVILLKRLVGDPRVPRRSKLIITGTIFYLVTPIDIVPDFVPGLGQLDDIVIALLALHSILNRVDESVIVELWDGEPGIIQAVRRGLGAVVRLLPGDWETRV